MKWNKIPCNKDKSNNDEYLRRSCDGIITLLHEFSVLLGPITPIFKLSLHFELLDIILHGCNAFTLTTSVQRQ